MSALKRQKYPMPDFIKEALEANQVMDLYDSRPPYQRNDYIGWITRGAKEETRRKRLDQMISELKDGSLYMKMKYHAK